MIVCTKCGTENSEGTQFCRKCGGYLDWSGVKVAVQAGSAVTARLKTPDVTVDPGGQATSELEINNDGRLVDEYRLQVSGVDPSWCSVEPASVRLMPRTSGLARVLFRPPRASSPVAGTGAYVVTATSSADPSVRAQAAGSLTIRPFADVSATITPQNSQSFGVADHTVSVENRGNAAIRVSVSAQDPDNRLTIEPSPPEMTVDGGAVSGSHLSVRTTNPKEPRTGQRIGFQVSVRPAVGAPIKLDATTVLLQRPVGLWSRLRVPLAAALLLLLAGGVVAYAGPPYPHWPPLPETTPSPIAPAVAKVTVNPPTVSFGTVQVGAGSSAVTLIVANSGTAKSTITPTLSDTKNYTMQNLCVSAVGPNQQCQVQVAFSPQAEGAFQASLSFSVSSGTAPQPVSLTGQGEGHAVLSCNPPTMSFSMVSRTSAPPATSAAQTLTCTNSGNGTLAITSVVLQDTTGKFSIQPSCPGTLAPGDKCTVAVQFGTTTVGQSFAASILINDSLGQQIVPLSGYRGFLITICEVCRIVVSPKTAV